MTGIEYFKFDGVPGDYFACVNGMGKLSTTACAKNYELAMSPHGLKEGRRMTCRACPVGALHAGIPAGVDTESRFVGSGFCARCERETTRLIRGTICVGCYNREREVLIGKNAKGGLPTKCRGIFSRTMACMFGGGERVVVRQFDRVASDAEAVLAVLKHEAKSCLFGWVASPMVNADAV